MGAGHQIFKGKPELLFTQIEDAVIQQQIDKHEATKKQNEAEEEVTLTPQKDEITYDDFQKMDIRIQNPCDFGFNPYRMKNKSFNMFVKDYFEYQEIYENPDKMKEYIHIQHLKKGQVFFGVNFEPADKMLNM